MMFIAAVVGVASGKPSPLCLEAERASRGVVFCSPEDIRFSFVGQTTGGKYTIYDYRYGFLPHPSGAKHGGQRLIVFRGEKYVGNYMLSPKVSVTVTGTEVVLKGDEDRAPVRIDLSRKPPSRLLVNGEVATFDR